MYNDDLGWNDTPLSEVVVPFGEVVGVKLDKATGKEVTDFKVGGGGAGRGRVLGAAGGELGPKRDVLVPSRGVYVGAMTRLRAKIIKRLNYMSACGH